MSVRKSSPKKRKKYKQKTYRRKGVKPAKISTSDNIEVVYEKDKMGDHYIASIFLREFPDRKVSVDLIGYNQENIENLHIDKQGGMILITHKEKDTDNEEIIFAIRDEILPRSKSQLRFKIMRDQNVVI